MRVIKSDQLLVIGWQYDNPRNPHKTDCILRDVNKEELARVTIIKHANDPQNKDKARKYSLNKLLNEQYPGRENRNVRKLFWDAYIHRNERGLEHRKIEL